MRNKNTTNTGTKQANVTCTLNYFTPDTLKQTVREAIDMAHQGTSVEININQVNLIEEEKLLQYLNHKVEPRVLRTLYRNGKIQTRKKMGRGFYYDFQEIMNYLGVN